jgi:hypothetical protein
MGFSFSDQDLERIGRVLNVKPVREGNVIRFGLKNEENNRAVGLDIYTYVELPPEYADRPANLVSVYAMNALLQLHGCTGMIASEELGEVIFFAKHHGVTNGLVIEREAGCSLYANVDDRLLSTDFTQLPPEVMMSSVALSMTEDLFSDLG